MNLIIAGTNRERSNSLKIAKYYEQHLTAHGEAWTTFSLTDLPADISVSDLYGKRSQGFEAIQSLISATTKFVFIIPEYNGSFPGILKTFIDACAFPASFHHKKVALVGISTGSYGNIRGLDHFTGVCNYLRMHVLPLKVHLPKVQNSLDVDGNIIDELTKRFIQEQIEEIKLF